MQSVTQIYLKIILFWEKGTFLSNITRDSVRLLDADFFWIIPCIFNITTCKLKEKRLSWNSLPIITYAPFNLSTNEKM